MSGYVDGNPAQVEILKIAMEDVDEGRIPSQVGVVVLREWVIRIRAQLHQLELKAQRDMLEDNEYEEMAVLKNLIDRYGEV